MSAPKLSKAEAGAVLMEALAGHANNASGVGATHAGPAMRAMRAREAMATPQLVTRVPGAELQQAIDEGVRRAVAQLVADGVLVVASPKDKP